MDFLRKAAEYVLPGPGNSYRPHLLRRRALFVFLGVILTAEALLAGNLALRQAGLPFLAAVAATEVIAHTNDARAEEGGTPLQESPLLNMAAERKAKDMAKNAYFAHVGPDGKQPWAWVSEAGYHYRYAGENLAVRFVDSRDVVDAWMGSPSHRANIVKGVYTDIGVGVAAGVYKGQPAVYVVQYFGTPVQPLFAAQGAAAASNSFFNSFIRQIGHYFADPRFAAGWMLALVASLLVVVLGLTFTKHVQIQPTEVLVPGAMVAVVAVSLLYLNGALLAPGSQAAATGLSGEVVIGAGAETEQ